MTNKEFADFVLESLSRMEPWVEHSGNKEIKEQIQLIKNKAEKIKEDSIEKEKIKEPRCITCSDWNPDLKYCMHLAKFMGPEDFCSEYRKRGD